MFTHEQLMRFPELSLEENVRQLIKQRRLQMLVHSCAYYRLNETIVSDHVYDRWARELAWLHKEFPELSKTVAYADAFADWDGESTTGYALPYNEPYIVHKAEHLIRLEKRELYGLRDS